MSERRLPRDRRRDVILDAAEVIFAELGYSATRLQDVAEASDVSKQLLQRHFASKRELLLTVVARQRDGLLQQLALDLPGATSAARMDALAKAWFRYVQENPATTRLLFADISGEPEIATFYEEMRSAARSATVEILRKEAGLGIPKPLLIPVAEMLRAATVGLARWWSEDSEMTLDEVAQLAVDVWNGATRSWIDRVEVPKPLSS